ncbi:hypothetical protein K6168_02540 [Streptomyces sp. FB2]|uniref:hypothetical protein n=1 Tax=Streptomyces sp. FB2 TaxID=2902454 RepID=UPI001F374D3B|nr:hypothetical protein [Streptomyces sp. FB2]MCF2534553.1 hypothetical protein [Streptomyces sp. FB2]
MSESDRTPERNLEFGKYGAQAARRGPSGGTGLLPGRRLGNLALPDRMVMAHRRTLHPVPAG